MFEILPYVLQTSQMLLLWLFNTSLTGNVFISEQNGFVLSRSKSIDQLLTSLESLDFSSICEWNDIYSSWSPSSLTFFTFRLIESSGVLISQAIRCTECVGVFRSRLYIPVTGVGGHRSLSITTWTIFFRYQGPYHWIVRYITFLDTFKWSEIWWAVRPLYEVLW